MKTKKEKAVLFLAQIRKDMTRNEIRAVAEKMAEAMCAKPPSKDV